MNVNQLINKPQLRKRVFTAKPASKYGLILQVHHTVQTKGQKQQKIRFVQAHFNAAGQILAAGDQAGNVYLVDFVHNKHWVLPNVKSCTALKFSSYNNAEVIVGMNGGKVCILNIETGEVTGELASHKQSVKDITFSHDHMCLTSSRCEAIVWDLRTNSKLQILNIEPACELKTALFMPVTSNILACFEDDAVLIWKHSTFEILKQILPTSWNKHPLKSIAFTRNGRAMVFSGHSPYLTIFMLDTWSVSSIITLPDCIQTVRKIDFVPQMFDGGSNRILVVLSGNGITYFFDMEQYEIINKIFLEEEVTNFDCSFDGKNIACVSKSGNLNVYKIAHYVFQQSGNDEKKRETLAPITTAKKSDSGLTIIQMQIKDVLDADKLRAILKEFGEYPGSYRPKIWVQLLDLPNNNQQYNALINQQAPQTSFGDLETSYPLENKIALKNLKKLLSNLVSWSPFFSQVTYLPVFVFPFVKVFQNDPVLCFEAVCSIIVNWCQHWFEYFPLPPLNILAIIENLLLEHDPQLLQHFARVKVTSKLYAWPLLEAAFSEVLSPSDWCRLWDHIMSNEPSFLLMCVVAYNILHRQSLVALQTESEFSLFYHNQNITDIKRLIAKSYSLLSNSSQKNHPRQYLQAFQRIEAGAYPHLLGYPKAIIDFNFGELDNLKREQQQLQAEEQQMLKARRAEDQQMELLEKQEEENERLRELQKVCEQTLSNERERVKEQRKRLINLRKQLHQEELDILSKSREKIIEKNTKDRQRALEKILDDVEQSRVTEELEVIKAESELVKHYSELLHHKIYLEEALNAEQSVPDPSIEHQILKRQQQKLSEELDKIQKDTQSKAQLKHLNIATGIAAMDNLIMRIEMELARQTADRYENINKHHSNLKIMKLEAETKELEMEVSKLLNLLAKMKAQETEDKLRQFNEDVFKENIVVPHNSHYIRQQRSREVKEKISTATAFKNDFKKLKKFIEGSRDNLDKRPRTSNQGTENEVAISD